MAETLTQLLDRARLMLPNPSQPTTVEQLQILLSLALAVVDHQAQVIAGIAASVPAPAPAQQDPSTVGFVQPEKGSALPDKWNTDSAAYWAGRRNQIGRMHYATPEAARAELILRSLYGFDIDGYQTMPLNLLAGKWVEVKTVLSLNEQQYLAKYPHDYSDALAVAILTGASGMRGKSIDAYLVETLGVNTDAAPSGE